MEGTCTRLIDALSYLGLRSDYYFFLPVAPSITTPLLSYTQMHSVTRTLQKQHDYKHEKTRRV